VGGVASTLILASRSPQRGAILTQLGIVFDVRVTDAEELTEGPPHELAIENAYRKAVAAATAPDALQHELVLGADTVVALGSRIYGKPADEAEARATLIALAGRAHAVVTGICLLKDGRHRTAAATTTVSFRARDDELLDWYLASGEWRERAGGYAVQGRGAALVESIDGDYTNVVGLPVPTLLELAPSLLS
jgi:septum formation protein